MDDKTDGIEFDWVPCFEAWHEPPKTYADAPLMGWDPRYGAVYRFEDSGAPEAGGHLALTRDDLSEDQTSAMDAVMAWFRDVSGRLHRGHALSMGGYAGTGKTTVVSLIAAEIGANNVAFVAYTGKASAVLRRKLRAASVHPGFCGTIHSCIYTPEVDEGTGRVTGWELREWSQLYDSTRLIICDEASMVNAEIWKDLCSYLIPVLAVGDPGQLPPIARDDASPVENPDVLLDKIHRQAEGNPVVEFATRVRKDQDWEGFTSSDPRFKRLRRGRDKDFVSSFYAPTASDGSDDDSVEWDWLDRALLCRYNKTRVGLNASIRGAMGRSGDPVYGDVVTVLKNTKIEGTKIYNGMRGIVVGDVTPLGDNHLIVPVAFPDDGVLVVAKMSRFQFGNASTFRSYEEAEEAGHSKVRRWDDMGVLSDYAYALTVHKSQGSQYSEVGMFIEGSRRDSREDNLRWIYTGATRASERLTVIG